MSFKEFLKFHLTVSLGWLLGAWFFLTFLAGCAPVVQVTKAVESKSYDVLARSFSEYCERADILPRTRIEARREIRQRGASGPHGPVIPEELDPKTAYGQGPVVRIWCEGEAVPDEVWPGLVRDWRD